MRVYDGNQIFEDYNGKRYSWYDASITPTFSKTVLQNSFVVNAWNADDNWTFELYIQGGKYGYLERVPETTADICANAFFAGEFFTAWYQDGQHYWYIKAPGGDPKAVKNWEIRATQTIPSSQNRKNTYSCTTLQTDYSGFQ